MRILAGSSVPQMSRSLASYALHALGLAARQVNDALDLGQILKADLACPPVFAQVVDALLGVEWTSR